MAIALNIIAATVAATFAVLTLACGFMTVEATPEGAPRGEARCAPGLHPVAPVQFLLSIAAIYSLWRNGPLIAMPLGAVSCILGWLSGLSGGFFTIIPGTLAFMAGVVGLMTRKRPDAGNGRIENAAPPLP